jgi:ubiquinone/menaquinone biosynthesis C-methylase UbiE
MKTEEIRNLAIKRHDIDADHFQSTYTQDQNIKENIFLYGRELILEELVKVLSGLPQGAKVLDIGSGTGHLTKWIEDKGYEVHGLEPSEEMIKHARRNFPHIVFSQGISSELPYDDNEFDLIVAFEVLRYMNREENKKSYQEFYRVLKPNGKIFITHVNKYATDLYYLFHPLKGLLFKTLNKTHHYCYSTTANNEENIIRKLNYTNVHTIGRLAATTRIAFKFGKGIGKHYINLMEKIAGKQRYLKYPGKLFAGHLILIGSKQDIQLG